MSEKSTKDILKDDLIKELVEENALFKSTLNQVLSLHDLEYVKELVADTLNVDVVDFVQLDEEEIYFDNDTLEE